MLFFCGPVSMLFSQSDCFVCGPVFHDTAAQPDRCGLQITITKKLKIKYVLKAKNTLTMLKIEK